MRRFVAPLLAVALVACVDDVGEGKVKAEITEAPAATEAAPAAAAVKTLKVDPSRSKLGALGAKITAKHPITFHDYTGEVGLAADGSVASVTFVAQMATLTSDAERLTSHLKNEDFFHVERFPTAEFASTAIVAGSDAAGATHTVTGDLTIRGQTKRVSFPATIATTSDGVTAKTEFVIDRKDFGVVYPGKPDDLVQDNVVLTVEFVASAANS